MFRTIVHVILALLQKIGLYNGILLKRVPNEEGDILANTQVERFFRFARVMVPESLIDGLLQPDYLEIKEDDFEIRYGIAHAISLYDRGEWDRVLGEFRTAILAAHNFRQQKIRPETGSWSDAQCHIYGMLA